MAITPTEHDTSRPWDRGEVIAAAVLAFAGISWFGWAQDAPPSSWVPFLAAGSMVSALLLALLVVLLVRHRTSRGSPLADPRVRRAYWIIIGVELATIIAGNVVLTATHHVAYQAVWTLFVVGIHFVPLARVMRVRGLAVTGIATACAAVAAAIVGLTSSVAPSAVAGLGGGAVFIGYAGWVLATGRREVEEKAT